MTPTAKRLIERLNDGAARCRRLAQAETEPIKTSVWNSWADCYEHCAKEVEWMLADVEAEARVLAKAPGSLRERLMAEEWR